MQFYITSLNWLKCQESKEEYERLDDQLYSISQDFKNDKIQEMFLEHRKSQIISLFRISTVFQVFMNMIYCFNIYFSYNAKMPTLFRGIFTVWLFFTLMIQQRLCFKWITTINFFLTLNSLINVAIFAHYYINVLSTLKSPKFVAQTSLLSGISCGLFAVSFFIICPSWRCQIIIVLGYYFTLMYISQGLNNYKQWYPSLIIIFVCIVLRMNDKYTKLMFLQVHLQKTNILACKNIFDKCVPSSIIVVKILKPTILQISESESLNGSKSHNFKILYANNFAQQYLECSTEFDCAAQIESIRLVQNVNESNDEDGAKSLTDILTCETWNQPNKNHDENKEYAIGSEKLSLSCCKMNENSQKNKTVYRKNQYCDVELKSCIWEGQQSIIIVINDTTDRINHIEQLKDLNQYKDQLLATVSHDLKTPLNVTQLLLFAMKQICKNKKVLEIVDIQNLLSNIKDIYLSNCMLITMINDLLDYSQIRKGTLRLQVEKFALDECLESVYGLFHRQTSSKGLKLNFQKINFIGPLFIDTDQNRLKQILINLLSNSLKFTFEGEINLRIDFQEPFIEFKVQDSGIGMPQSVVKKLFQQYATFNLGNKNAQGVGLGLVISSKLVGLLGPSEVITVESDQGVGTTFSFKIYRSLNIIKNASEIDEQYTDYAQHPNQTRQSTKLIQLPKNQINKFQVLIVDDVVFNIQAFKTIIQKIMTCNVTEFYNGSDAVKSVQSGKIYDIIFMDINMPVMDGYIATKLIRKFEIEQGTKPSVIVIASAQTIEQEFFMVNDSGANELIEKPVQIKKLIEMIKKYKFVN